MTYFTNSIIKDQLTKIVYEILPNSVGSTMKDKVDKIAEAVVDYHDSD